MTLLERAVRPTAGAMRPRALPAARAALEPAHRAPCSKSRHIEMLAARLRICRFGVGAAKVAALRGRSARLETAALPRSEGFAA